jgi:hypothetical protein
VQPVGANAISPLHVTRKRSVPRACAGQRQRGRANLPAGAEVQARQRASTRVSGRFPSGSDARERHEQRDRSDPRTNPDLTRQAYIGRRPARGGSSTCAFGARPPLWLAVGSVNGSRERGWVRALAGRQSSGSTCSWGRNRDFVARVSRERCTARQPRRHGRALSYYACSSCIARQASRFGTDLLWCAGFLGGCDGARSRFPFPSAVKPRRLPTKVAGAEKAPAG